MKYLKGFILDILPEDAIIYHNKEDIKYIKFIKAMIEYAREILN